MTKTRKLDIAIIVVILLIGFSASLWMTSTNNKIEGLQLQVSILTRQQEDRQTPRIQINRATIYNTDGEIVLEAFETKEDEK